MAVTVEDVRARYRDLLHISEAKEPSYVAGLAAVALGKAEGDIAAIFGGNGFTAGQISAWNAYDETLILQSLFWLLSMGALLVTPENQRALKEIIKLLDQREALSGMYPGEDGQPVVPGKILSEMSFGPVKIIPPDGRGMPGEPFRDSNTGGWRRM